ELAALVDRSRRLRRGVAGDASRKRELAEQPTQPLLVAADVRVDLAVGALEVQIRHDTRATVAGSRDVDAVQVPRTDHPVEVGIDEVEPRRRAPVSEQPRLGVRELQGFAQQRIVEQVDLPNGQVVGGTPVRVQRVERLIRQGHRGERYARGARCAARGSGGELLPEAERSPCVKVLSHDRRTRMTAQYGYRLEKGGDQSERRG